MRPGIAQVQSWTRPAGCLRHVPDGSGSPSRHAARYRSGRAGGMTKREPNRRARLRTAGRHNHQSRGSWLAHEQDHRWPARSPAEWDDQDRGSFATSPPLITVVRIMPRVLSRAVHGKRRLGEAVADRIVPRLEIQQATRPASATRTRQAPTCPKCGGRPRAGRPRQNATHRPAPAVRHQRSSPARTMPTAWSGLLALRGYIGAKSAPTDDARVPSGLVIATRPR